MLTVKRNVSFLMGCLIITSVFLFPCKTFAAFQPEWVQTYISGTLKMQDLYYGASFSDYKGEIPNYEELRRAKDRALDELCYQLSVSIQSKFEDSIVKKGEYEEQHIVSSLFISTRNVLSGVQEKDKWTDDRKHRHWVLLVIDKEKADQQVKQQKFINEVADRLESKQDEILEGIKQMTSLLNNTMQIYKDRMNQLEGLLKTIDTKVEASGDQTKREYSALRKEIMRLESSRKAYEERLAGPEKNQSEQMEVLIAQNKALKVLMGQLSERIQGDYFLALTNDDIQYKEADTDFRITLKPDKGQGADYFDGDKVRFLVQSSRGCYIKVVYISSTEGVSAKENKINTILFPNAHDRDNWIAGGKTKVIGRLGELEIQPPFGRDVISVIASEKQFDDIGELLQRSPDGYYSETTSNTRGALDIRSRGIQIVPPESGTVINTSTSHICLAPVATDTCFVVSHPR